MATARGKFADEKKVSSLSVKLSPQPTQTQEGERERERHIYREREREEEGKSWRLYSCICEAKHRIHMGSFRHKTRVHSGTFRYIQVHSRLFDSFTSHWRPRKRWKMRIRMGSFSATTSTFYNIKWGGIGKRERRKKHGWEATSRNLHKVLFPSRV